MTRHPAPASPVRDDDIAAHDIAAHHIAAHGMRRLLSAGALDLPPSPLRAEWRVDRDADHRAGAWRSTGPKAWCRGAATCDRALVTAHAPDGFRPFADRQVYVRQSHGDRAALGRLVVAGADA